MSPITMGDRSDSEMGDKTLGGRECGDFEACKRKIIDKAPGELMGSCILPIEKHRSTN